MTPLKSPGLDGFSACFYQAYWDIIKTEVCNIVLKFLNDGILDDSHNFTYNVLIPKVSNPIKPNDFRSISLCNVIYKLASKVLANRLKKLLPDIISPSQSAFNPGRLIIYNVIIAYEALHSIEVFGSHDEETWIWRSTASHSYEMCLLNFLCNPH